MVGAEFNPLIPIQYAIQYMHIYIRTYFYIHGNILCIGGAKKNV